MTEEITLRAQSHSSADKPTTADMPSPTQTLDTVAPQNPFTDEQNPMSDFFEGGDRIEQLDEAIHLSQFGNNIALISGDTGVGKTFFLEQACYELSETAACCFITGTTTLTSQEIAKDISTELSMPFATSQTIEQLIDMLDDADALLDVSRFIIIVDDIHLLAEDIIFSLLHISQLSNNVFHLLGSGLPSTLNYLESLEFQEGLIKEIYLYPYSQADTRQYLNFKMKAAGYEGDNFFDEDIVNQLYTASGGYPQRINNVAEQYLLRQEDAMLDEGESRTTGLPLWHMIGLVFLIFALILAFFYRGASTDDTAVEQTLPPPLENPAPVESTVIDTSETNLGESASATVEQATNTASIPTSTPSDTTALEPSASNQTPDENTLTSTPTTAPELNSTDTESAGNDPSANTVEAPAAETTSGAENTVNATAPAPIETTNTAAAPENTGSAIPAASNETTPNATADEPTAAAAPTSPTTAFSADEQVVLGWPEDHSTIQVIGALDKASLEQYIAAQPNKDSLRLVSINRNDQAWHIVLADHYPDNTQARAAIQKLPQNQVNAGPWIRKVSDLKQGIRDFSR